MTVQEIKLTFESIYSKAVDAVYFSPGRVNLIGEHVDYNGGSVFPCALNFGTYLFVAENKDQVIKFNSLNQQESLTLSFDQLTTPLRNSWINYPLGVIAQFIKSNYEITEGFDLLFWSDVPNGAGLSSSAALEVVTAFAPRLYNKGLPRSAGCPGRCAAVPHDRRNAVCELL